MRSFQYHFRERKFFNQFSTIYIKFYENIQHSMDIYDEIFTFMIFNISKFINTLIFRG